MKCNSTGGPDNSYAWQKGGDYLNDENSTTLTLPNVTSSTGGTYSCVVSNAAGFYNSSTFFYVYPYFIEQPMRRILTSAGSSINLTCIAEAFPSPEFSWGRENRRDIKMGILTNSSILVISSVEFGDEGNYYCNVTSYEYLITSQDALVSGKSLLLFG